IQKSTTQNSTNYLYRTLSSYIGGKIGTPSRPDPVIFIKGKADTGVCWGAVISVQSISDSSHSGGRVQGKTLWYQNHRTMSHQFFRFFPAALLLVGLLSGCSSSMKVYHEEEPGANLFQYYSYKWLPNNGVLPGDPAQYRIADDTESKIRTAVDLHMQHCGYRICDSGPDLVLHYHVVVKNRVYYQRDWTCDETQHEGASHAYCQRVKPVYFQEGTLILDFIDGETGNQVWRGVAVGIMEGLNTAEVDRRIEEAVRQIFRRYPVKPLPHTDPRLSLRQ
ncbi:MAG TPA: DUF4136 domain-containing protein, partial [Saprospiraceae bacterium]|nr:DUF4136 domain-containing protein [Saprospiraceae bacterium]